VGHIFVSPDLAIRKVTVWAVLTNAAVIEDAANRKTTTRKRTRTAARTRTRNARDAYDPSESIHRRLCIHAGVPPGLAVAAMTRAGGADARLLSEMIQI